MPIGPKRSGSADSMMQYTYLPRLATALSGMTERPWTIFSDARRAGSALAARVSRAAGLDVFGEPFGLGGEQENVEDGPNQFAGKRDIDRITLTVGKFAIGESAWTRPANCSSSASAWVRVPLTRRRRSSAYRTSR